MVSKTITRDLSAQTKNDRGRKYADDDCGVWISSQRLIMWYDE